MHPHHERADLDTVEIYESPKELPDMRFWTDSPESAAKYMVQLKADETFKQVGDFNGSPIYSSGNFFLFSEVSGQISFMVRWERHPFPGNRGDYVTQIALWRDRLLGQKGLSEYVFWNFIFQMTHSVMTDGSQTKTGKQFWKSRASDALQRNGVSLYLVNVRDYSARLISNTRQYTEAALQAYGSEDRHRDLRLLITDKGLRGLNLTSW